jgi:hypothetical protein
MKILLTLLLLIPSLSWGMRMISPLNYSLELSDNFIYFDKSLIKSGEFFETVPSEFYLNPLVNELVTSIRKSKEDIDYFLYFDDASKKAPNNKKHLIITIKQSINDLREEVNQNDSYKLINSYKFNENYLNVTYSTQSKNVKNFESAIQSFENFFSSLEVSEYYPKINKNIFGDPKALAKNKELYEAYKKSKDDAFQLKLLEAKEKFGSKMANSSNNLKNCSVDYTAGVFYGNECSSGKMEYISTSSLSPSQYDYYMDLYSLKIKYGKTTACQRAEKLWKKCQ